MLDIWKSSDATIMFWADPWPIALHYVKLSIKATLSYFPTKTDIVMDIQSWVSTYP